MDFFFFLGEEGTREVGAGEAAQWRSPHLKALHAGKREKPTFWEFSWLCFLDQTGEAPASFRETPNSWQKGALGIPDGSGIISISSGSIH